MRLFNKHTEPVDVIDLPETYDPEHPESGATTAEYGMLAGGVVLIAGVAYTFLKGGVVQELIEGILKALLETIMNMITGAFKAGVIDLPGVFF